MNCPQTRQAARQTDGEVLGADALSGVAEGGEDFGGDEAGGLFGVEVGALDDLSGDFYDYGAAVVEFLEGGYVFRVVDVAFAGEGELELWGAGGGVRYDRVFDVDHRYVGLFGADGLFEVEALELEVAEVVVEF